ncbi:hypothetical protein [Calothrix rhizosoleniae]|uniref:hypothetical protein n=1 Tax=Calothrix rhizosoleniae TaxID=888997 RepID=UPI0011777415|nr:hypothetical protein [Calothrix rhizosoleniae]
MGDFCMDGNLISNQADIEGIWRDTRCPRTRVNKYLGLGCRCRTKGEDGVGRRAIALSKSSSHFGALLPIQRKSV